MVINYQYDDLYRLTTADYYNADTYVSGTSLPDYSYQYTYDAVGNRLTAMDPSSTTSYQYDIANRLVDVNGTLYTWDANGNLLSDSVNTYTYDLANHLASSTNGTTSSTYAYNGLGDRLSQTVNGQTTNYTLDLNAGLTQVLSDGTSEYTYGAGRIAQFKIASEQAGRTPPPNPTTEYFLGDALGSVRQLTNLSGQVTLAKSYDPYGTVTASSGTSQSIYGFTAEQTGDSGLVYLRARYYNPNDGRFLTKDPSKLEANPYLYTKANPVNRIDPTGLFSRGIIEKNIPLSAFAAPPGSWTEHSPWGFYALLQHAENLDSVMTGYVPISLAWNANRFSWSNPETVKEVNCEKIMIGSQFLDQYYAKVVKKHNEPAILWRDTTASFYDLSRGSSPHTAFIDGFDNNKNTYPDFLGVSVGAWYGEVGVLIDMDGNRYLAISGGIGKIAGVGYIEGYLCDWRPGWSCANQPSPSEIEQAIAGICVGGELVILLGVNISPFCHGANLSKPSDWSSSISTFYLGLEAGIGGGGTLTLPLSPFGIPPKPDRGWRWLIESRRNGMTYDKIK